MTSFIKPNIRLPNEPTNALGKTRAEYDGTMSTLCAGCGHDSVTAALARTFYELSMDPTQVVKVSGIGCSSKTTTYFLKDAHGANTVHGRMPSFATGAAAVNKHLTYVGVSGDGDSLSIGLGQMAHAMRRNVDMIYMLENNGVYGLTKGQFSASADIGSTAKKGATNVLPPIDPALMALATGATFVARSFSGDKAQLVSLIKAGIAHRGFALIDVISPCVSFNDHKGSTKSYAHTYQYYHKAVHADYVPLSEEITTSYDEGETIPVELHDGGTILLRKLDADYDPTDRAGAMAHLVESQQTQEILTGLLYIDESRPALSEHKKLPETPLHSIPYEKLNPGAEALRRIQEEFR